MTTLLKKWLVATAVGVLASIALGCSEEDDDDGASDSDTDVDTDTDTDSDGDQILDIDGGPCSIDAERIYADVAFLASEELEGRYPGGDGNEMALQMAESRFAEIGLVPMGDDGTYRQAFQFEDMRLMRKPAVAMGALELEFGRDFDVLPGSRSADLESEIVFAGYGLTVPPFDVADYPECPFPADGYDDYAGIDVAGKVVLVASRGPGDDERVRESCPGNQACDGEACLWDLGYKAANAKLHGAEAVVLVQNRASATRPLRPGGPSRARNGLIASLSVRRGPIDEAFPHLQDWLDGIDGDYTPHGRATGVTAIVSVLTEPNFVTTYNILGALEGEDPALKDEVVVVGGHIDHLGVVDSEICYGADDNASGSAVTLELARVLATCVHPARTTLFALWNAEEEGLIGSSYYVANPKLPLETTFVAFSLDMVGAGDGSTLHLYGVMESGNTWLNKVIPGAAADMGLPWTVTPDFQEEGSDHAPFAHEGIPAACAMSGAFETHPAYHTPADNIDGIAAGNLQMTAYMMIAGLKTLIEGTEDQYLK